MNTNCETQRHNTNDDTEWSVPELLGEPVDTSEASDHALDDTAPGEARQK